LLQQRSAGLGSMAGGGGGDSVQTERRGGEKVIHKATIVLAVLFCAVAFIIPIVS